MGAGQRSRPAPHDITVKVGQPLAPPRDYAHDTQIPDPKDYLPIATGRLYDVADQGIENGALRFETGYSIDGLVQPGSGQFETARPSEKTIKPVDLGITIRKYIEDVQGPVARG